MNPVVENDIKEYFNYWIGNVEMKFIRKIIYKSGESSLGTMPFFTTG